MNRNNLNKKLQDLSLLFGYLFILIVLVSFAFIQFSSTQNLQSIETELRIQILSLASLEVGEIDEAILRFEEFKNTGIFSNLNSTLSYSNSLYPLHSINSKEELIIALQDIGSLLDSYSDDLYRSQAILFITFIGLSIILSILLTISEFDQIKKYEREKNKRITDRKLMDILESERNLIALELHDDVAQKLSVISQHFDHSHKEDHSELLKRYNSDVIHKVRTMAQSLRSPEFHHGDFQKQIEFLYADFISISNIKLDASFRGLKALQIDEDQKLHIYRIIQELLSNCRKHSSADKVDIIILYVHPIIKITYNDDGIGLDENVNYSGLGMKSIKYRLRVLNATMEIKSNNDGLGINLNIPVVL